MSDVVVKNSGKAVAALVLGILGLFACVVAPLFALPAIIFGSMALSQIKKAGGTLTGNGKAVAGLVLGLITLLIWIVFAALSIIAIPSFEKARDNARRIACVNNLRLIESAKDCYAIDYGGTNGTTLTWDNLSMYMKDMNSKLFCPKALPEMRSPDGSYIMGSVGTDAECRIDPEKHTLGHNSY